MENEKWKIAGLRPILFSSPSFQFIGFSIIQGSRIVVVVLVEVKTPVHRYWLATSVKNVTRLER